MQVKIYCCGVVCKKKASPKRRSGCPLNASVEILGHPWSLPIIRDMMVRGFPTCKEFLERIATIILPDRLRKFEAHGITTTERDRSVERTLICLLKAKGIDLGPLPAQIVLWQTRTKIAAIRVLGDQRTYCN